MIETALERYYSNSNERLRLNTHVLERDRTLQILQQRLPKAPSIVADIGGAAGVYAFSLALKGYEVHLADPVPIHIEHAKEQALTSSLNLASYQVADARYLESFSNASVDVVLFFGPLYHLFTGKDRHQALKEAWRILKPDGLLFASGISRIASFIDAMHKNAVSRKAAIIERSLTTGVYEKSSEGFNFSYLHHPNELREEVKGAGFTNIELISIEGPVWDTRVVLEMHKDPQSWQECLRLLAMIEADETVIGASAHIMAIGRKLLI